MGSGNETSIYEQSTNHISLSAWGHSQRTPCVWTCKGRTWKLSGECSSESPAPSVEGPASHHISWEVRGQSTPSQVKFVCFVYRHFVYRHFVYCHFVYCHSVSSTVGSISAEPGTCFSLSIALQCTCSLALFLGSPLTLTKNRLPAHTQNFKMVYCFKEKQNWVGKMLVDKNRMLPNSQLIGYKLWCCLQLALFPGLNLQLLLAFCQSAVQKNMRDFFHTAGQQWWEFGNVYSNDGSLGMCTVFMINKGIGSDLDLLLPIILGAIKHQFLSLWDFLSLTSRLSISFHHARYKSCGCEGMGIRL